MDEKHTEDARQSARQLIWSGFDSPDEVHTIVTEDYYQPGAIDGDALNTWIQEQAVLKAQEELMWPEITDCDRLTSAFEELDQEGIIALENEGYESSDGMQAVSEIYEDQGGAASGIVGYCFYHGQDLPSAVDGGGLWLSFGDIDGDDTRGVVIGERVVAVLTRHGLDCAWNGTIKQRIEIPKIVWQRRYKLDIEIA